MRQKTGYMLLRVIRTWLTFNLKPVSFYQALKVPKKQLRWQRKQRMIGLSLIPKLILDGYCIYWAKEQRQMNNSIKQVSFKLK